MVSLWGHKEFIQQARSQGFSGKRSFELGLGIFGFLSSEASSYSYECWCYARHMVAHSMKDLPSFCSCGSGVSSCLMIYTFAYTAWLVQTLAFSIKLSITECRKNIMELCNLTHWFLNTRCHRGRRFSLILTVQQKLGKGNAKHRSWRLVLIKSTVWCLWNTPHIFFFT